MNNIIVCLTMKLEKDMTEKEIIKMMDEAILKGTDVKLWTVKIEDAPDQTWG